MFGKKCAGLLFGLGFLGGGLTAQTAPVPHAIVSLALATDEILLDLVPPQRLRALESFVDDPGISNAVVAARAVPGRVSADKERLVALQPDLVIVADWKEKEFVQFLREVKIPVLVFKTPETFPQLFTLIRQLAQATGTQARGESLIGRLQQRLDAVTQRVGSLPAGRRATVLSYNVFDGSTYAQGTSFQALVEQAGLINAASAAGMVGWPRLSKEKILDLDPDFIILPSWSYSKSDQPEQRAAEFLRDPLFSRLKAVQRHQVVILRDQHLQANSQYMVDGVEDLARLAYPERFR